MPFKDLQKRKEYNKIYREKNHNIIALNKKTYKDNNKDLVLSQKKECYRRNRLALLKQKKIYSLINKKKISCYIKQYNSRPEVIKQRNKKFMDKYNNDIQFRLTVSLRNRLRIALKKDVKSGSAVRDLRCSIAELKFYIEGKFTDGMSWDNYGKWHIDHIIPISFFNLSDREQFLKSCHYTNLQPLWALENLTKSNKPKTAYTHVPRL